MRGDARSRRVAVVSDSLLNPPPDAPDPLARLAAEGWGVMALPAADYAPSVRAELRDAIVEQVVTFLDDDYEVVCVHADDEEIGLFLAALDAQGRSPRRTISLEQLLSEPLA